jgi:hypothetical protein
LKKLVFAVVCYDVGPVSGHNVSSAAATDHIFSCGHVTIKESIVAVAAGETVTRVAHAFDGIEEEIMALAARHGVAPRTAIKVVIAGPARQVVITG